MKSRKIQINKFVLLLVAFFASTSCFAAKSNYTFVYECLGWNSENATDIGIASEKITGTISLEVIGNSIACQISINNIDRESKDSQRLLAYDKFDARLTKNKEECSLEITQGKMDSSIGSSTQYRKAYIIYDLLLISKKTPLSYLLKTANEYSKIKFEDYDSITLDGGDVPTKEMMSYSLSNEFYAHPEITIEHPLVAIKSWFLSNYQSDGYSMEYSSRIIETNQLVNVMQATLIEASSEDEMEKIDNLLSQPKRFSCYRIHKIKLTEKVK